MWGVGSDAEFSGAAGLNTAVLPWSNILTSTNVTEHEKKQYGTVLQKFDDFFKVRVKQTLERAKFNRHCQNESETADEYSRLVQLSRDLQLWSHA